MTAKSMHNSNYMKQIYNKLKEFLWQISELPKETDFAIRLNEYYITK